MEKSKHKKINLYIVCSNKSEGLSKQWEDIVKWSKDIDVKYAEKENENGFSVDIHTVGYRSPEDRDTVADSFIKYKADIVVFLIDEQKDWWVMKQLDRALRLRRRYCRPEILVYISNSTLEKRNDIQTILKENSISLHTVNEETLKTSIENNIRAYVDSYDMQRQTQKEAKRRPIYIIVFFLLVCALLFLIHNKIVSKLNYEKTVLKQPRILVAGGGSAKTLIEQRYMSDDDQIDNIQKHPFWMYSPIPTRSGYRLLTEEAAMDINNNDYKKRNYYSVSVAAKKAKDDDFLQYNIIKKDSIATKEDSLATANNRRKAIEEFRKTGVVMGIHMGMDTLFVYSKNVAELQKLSLVDTLKLGEIICRYMDSSIIYTTNAGSGTLVPYVSFLKSYLNCDTCRKTGKINKKLVDEKIKQLEAAEHGRIFYSLDTIDKDQWIALGSRYYAPPIACDTIIVFNAKPKPVYVYFMRYRELKESTQYVLPKEMRSFLKGIGIGKNVIDAISNYPVNDNSDSLKILFDNICIDTTCNIEEHKTFRNSL